MNNKITFIYGLFSRSNPSLIKYIGKSDDPYNRLLRHKYNTSYHQKQNKKLTHKENWIIKNNFEIDYIILEKCNYNNWQEKEINYISKYTELTNTSKGGKGGCGLLYKLSYFDVKIWAKTNLNIKSKSEWYSYVKNNDLPDFIPHDPRVVYLTRGWVSWGDFLNTGKKWDNDVNYLSYNESKNQIKYLNIKNINDYRIKHKNNIIPKTIPIRPDRYFKKRGWTSWGEFLSNGKIANQFKTFVSYDIFKNIMTSNKINSHSKFKQYLKLIEREKNIPTNPNITYKNSGWISWNVLFNKF
jgi:hypothetical protein